MALEKGKIKVSLAGHEIVLRAGEGNEVYLQTLASYVDGKMRDLRERTGTIPSQKLALLAALDIADELFSSQKKARTFRGEVRERSKRLLDMIETQPTSEVVG